MQYRVVFTKEQLDRMMMFLDIALKRDGLAVLEQAVDVYNVLMKAIVDTTVDPLKEDNEKEE